MGKYAVAIIGAMSGQVVSNTMGASTGDTTSVDDAQDIAEAIHAAWAAHMLDDASDNYALETVTVQGIDNTAVWGIWTDVVTGLNTAAPLPAYVTVNARLVTGLRGRAYNGRTGISGVVINQVDTADSNTLADAAQASYVNSLNAFRTTFEGNAGLNTPRLAVVSRVLNGAPRAAPLLTTVTSFEVAKALGSRNTRKR
jgi:hypothetical protein